MLSLTLHALFLFVLNQSIVASCVIVAVLVVRLLLKPAPKIFSYALWGVVLFRLFCPLSFESAISLIPVSAQPISQEIVMAKPAVGSVPSTLVDGQPSGQTAAQGAENASTPVAQGDAANRAPTNSAPAGQVAGVAGATSQGQAAEPNTAPSTSLAGDHAGIAATGATALQRWLSVGCGVWLLGLGVLLVYSVVGLLRLRYELQVALPLAVPQAEGQAPCAVYASDCVSTAFVFGLLRPKVYLPMQLSRGEMQYILCHEQTHIRRGDHIIKCIAFLAVCLHWFNPLVWVAFFLSGKDMELSCDESVIKTLGHGIKKEYSASLLSLATGKRIWGGAPLAFGEGDTKGRIQNVLRYQAPARWLMLVAGGMLLCVMLVLLTTRQGMAGASATSAEREPAPLQAITTQLAADALPADTRQPLLALAQQVVQDAVDALNAAGANPADGSNNYYVTEAAITGLVSQSTGAADESVAVGIHALTYEITLSTTDDITLPQGYQLVEASGAQGLCCTSTADAQSYLYLFGGAYSGAAQWQTLGAMTYAEILRWYGGPARLSYYGDAITASACELLHDCKTETVDFAQFSFAPPQGLTVELSAPPVTMCGWYADLKHGGRAEHLWLDYHAFAMGGDSFLTVTWYLTPRTIDGSFVSLAMDGQGGTQMPTICGVYTDEAGQEYLFAYASATGAMASQGGTDYTYAIYQISEAGEVQTVENNRYCFAPGAAVSTDGVPLQTALDTINAYAKASELLISTDQSVQYYTADGTPVTLPFGEQQRIYLNERTIQRMLAPYDGTGTTADLGEAEREIVQAPAGVAAQYMQVVPL